MNKHPSKYETHSITNQQNNQSEGFGERLKTTVIGLGILVGLGISGYCAIKYTIPKWHKEMISNQHTKTQQASSSISKTHQQQRENNQPITLTSKVVTQQFDNSGIAETNYDDTDIRGNQAYVASKVGHYLARITNLKDYQVNIISNANYSRWGDVTNYSQMVYLTKKN